MKEPWKQVAISEAARARLTERALEAVAVEPRALGDLAALLGLSVLGAASLLYSRLDLFALRDGRWTIRARPASHEAA